MPLYDDDFEWIPYARISDDREGGGLGAKRQIDDCLDMHRTARLGGRILDPLVDNDLTAYNKSSRYKPRPDYDKIPALLRERPGRRGILAWHTDRLHRTPRELEDFIDLIEETRAPVHTVRSGVLDLSTASGRMTARVHCAVARHESEHKSERILRKVAELAADGKIGNGGHRPFGYKRIYVGEGPRRKILRDDLDLEEAAIVRELARRVLAGESSRSIIIDLKARGIKTSTGGDWSKQGLRVMLRSARIAGLRERRGVVVGKAAWPAIIGEDTHKQLRALLDSKERYPGSLTRLHYLSGHVYCGRCETVRMGAGANHGKPIYSCPAKPEGCNGRTISRVDLEEFVDAYMIRKLSDRKTLRELAARQAAADGSTRKLLDRIESDERRLDRLQAELEDGSEDGMPEVAAAIRTIRRRLGMAREELARQVGMPAVAAKSLPDLARRWPSLSIGIRQQLLVMFVARIVIGPGRRGAKFDPARVDIVPVASNADG